jgi:hypothetical protein
MDVLVDGRGAGWLRIIEVEFPRDLEEATFSEESWGDVYGTVEIDGVAVRFGNVTGRLTLLDGEHGIHEFGEEMAFAGTDGGTVTLSTDEVAAVEDAVWEVLDTALAEAYEAADDVFQSRLADFLER